MSSPKRLDQPVKPPTRVERGTGATAGALIAYPLPRLTSVLPYVADPDRTAWDLRTSGGAAAGRARDYYFA